jgi:hypothetical protein
MILKKREAHGWRGNTTDEKPDFEIAFASQSLSVVLPRHPWA